MPDRENMYSFGAELCRNVSGVAREHGDEKSLIPTQTNFPPEQAKYLTTLTVPPSEYGQSNQMVAQCRIG